MSCDIMTLQETAEFLRISPASVRRLADSGELPAIPVRGKLLFLRQVVLDFVARPRSPRR